MVIMTVVILDYMVYEIQLSRNYFAAGGVWLGLGCFPEQIFLIIPQLIFLGIEVEEAVGKEEFSFHPAGIVEHFSSLENKIFSDH